MQNLGPRLLNRALNRNLLDKGGAAGVFASAPLDLRFALQKTLDPRITFTRASTGTFVGSDGLLKSATTNEPRFDHNPTTGESLGLLVEEARTNLLVRSEEFNDATWTKVNTTVTANSIAAPNGTVTADTITDSNDGASTAHSTSTANQSLTSGLTYTISVYAKAGTQPGIAFIFPSSAFTSNLNARFNISTGTIANLDSGLTGSITAVGDGWYRCTATATATATASAGFQIRIATASTSFYQGNGTGTIYLWGAQLEAGAFPTSYIPTTSATVTRAADVASITGSNFSSWYRQDAVSVFSQSTKLNAATGAPFSINDGTSNNRISGLVSASNFIAARNTAGAGTLFTPSTVNPPVSGLNKMAQASTNLDHAVVGNGGTVATAATYGMPVVDRLDIGSQLSGSYLNGSLARLTFWPTRLSNTTLQQITQ